MLDYFEWIQPLFMKRALIALLLAAPLFGLLGSTIVANRMAFFSDALAHGAFAGIALGMLFGLSISRGLATLLFSVFFALSITFIRFRSRASSDTVIGVFASMSSAIGLIILSRFGNFSRYSHALTGDILTISVSNLWSLASVFVVVVLLWGTQVNHNFLCQVDEGLARSYGIKPLRPALVFSLALACVVSVAISWVGVLLINALLVLPAAASRIVAPNLRSYHWIAVCIAVFSGVAGLISSYYLNLNTSATIVVFCGLIYLLAVAYNLLGHYLKKRFLVR
ncbi:MAG: metal ABC transporter permease [Spirochaetia bacterium]